MNSCVDVLMSTYNGEKYLVEQLESILAQTHRAMTLTIRDDGSRDSTPEILTRYAHLDARIKLSLQENKGVVRSFHWLLAHADPGCHYYAFADQDDVWMPNKLERALSVLSGYNGDTPLLYSTRLEYVSADLRHLGVSPRIVNTPCFCNALVQNISTGCTVVMNKAARELLLKHEWPRQVLVHDWWAHIVVSAFGRVVHDDFAPIKYRQHAGNQIGGTVTFFGDLRKRTANFLSRQRNGFFGCYDQALGFWMTYKEELTGDNLEILKQFIDSKGSFLHRLRYLFGKNRVHRQRSIDDVLLRLLILMNRY